MAVTQIRGNVQIKAGTVSETELNTSVAGAGLAGGGGTALSVNVDGTTLAIDTDTLEVNDGGIDSLQIAGGAVDVDHLSDLRVVATGGLAVDYNGGTVRNDNTILTIAASSFSSLPDNDVSYIEVDGAGSVTNNTVGFTAGRLPIAEVTTVAGAVTSVVDKRAWLDIESGVGSVTPDTFVTRETPTSIALDGVDTTADLANTPIAGSEEVYLNGILQNEGGSNDYTISANVITFTTAPQAGDKILVSYRK